MVNTAETVYRDYQKVTLQESPGTVRAKVDLISQHMAQWTALHTRFS